MDSITQITLGAAVGEIVLGKKIGNRAMIWGAVAGTIPDLDIFANLILAPVDALAAHRGISHSLIFPIVVAPVLGWLVHRFYKEKLDRNLFVKGLISLLGILVCCGIGYLLLRGFLSGSPPGILPVVLGILVIGLLIKRVVNYWQTDWSLLGQEASFKDWSLLFFWGIFTHPLLDCFTSYGTQLFQPFSDYRVAFSSVSVADPIYTVPFIACVVTASYLSRHSAKRKWFNWTGILLSSLYLSYTVWNKFYVNNIFEKSMAEQGIQYNRYFVSPTIFNNVLWQGIAESDHRFYYGVYSLNDTQPLMQIDSLYKDTRHLKKIEHYREVKILKWFTSNYYTVDSIGENQYKMNDLRFGIIGNLEQPRDTSGYVFQFYLTEKDGQLNVLNQRNTDRPLSKEFNKLWTRIKGN